MLLMIVLSVFGGLLGFGILYDLFVRKSFKKVDKIHDEHKIDHHAENAKVDSAANSFSRQSGGHSP